MNILVLSVLSGQGVGLMIERSRDSRVRLPALVILGNNWQAVHTQVPLVRVSDS